MIGAMIGDVVGSVYEFDNIKTKVFELFKSDCEFTDDTVMTVAVADALLSCDAAKDRDAFKQVLIRIMHRYGKAYPHAGYGHHFGLWLTVEGTKPYNSYGNGSAMRVSPVGWYARTLAQTIELAAATAEITHNHPEGIKGAAVAAGAVFLARSGESRERIREFAARHYDVGFTLDEIRSEYRFNESCQKTVPQALVAFFESVDFEDAIRNAISLGGDSDTLAAITGAVAEAFYGIPPTLRQTVRSYLDERLLDVVDEFEARYGKG